MAKKRRDGTDLIVVISAKMPRDKSDALQPKLFDRTVPESSDQKTFDLKTMLCNYAYNLQNVIKNVTLFF